MKYFFYRLTTAAMIALTISMISADSLPQVECLYDSVYLEIDDDYTAEMTINQKFRFNQPGNLRYASLRESVNKYVEFEFGKLVYEMPGGAVIKFNEDDIETIPDYGQGYYPDRKTRRIRLPSTRTGAIAEVSYKLVYKNLLYLPQFLRQLDIPVNNSYFMIRAGIPLEYTVSPGCFDIYYEGEALVIEADSIRAFINEEAMPVASDYRIVVRPDTIRYNDRSYSIESWNDVALFYNELSDINSLPDRSLIELAKEICAGADSFVDSLEFLFNYVRDNIRYISVDLGRGDFQPLPAPEVNQKKYGDCKDQTSLLIALCRAVGIDANPALITTRERPSVIIDLPWPGYFDHVITAIDTTDGFIFLDASRQTCCFGSLPPKLRNRKALICGHESFLDFTLTSAYQPDNRISIDMNYFIEPDGGYRCSFDLEFFNDPAFTFYSKTAESSLTEIVGSMLDLNYSVESYPGVVISNYEPDYIKIEGLYFGESSRPQQYDRLLFSYKSPLLKYLQNYFKTGDRINTYVFDFTFNMDEHLSLDIPEGYMIEKDSLSLNFRGKGLEANLYMSGDNEGCRNYKDFHVIDYNLTTDRYIRFHDFLLTALRTPYNSIVLKRIPESEKPE